MLAGWRRALSVGLAGVRSSGRRGHQGGGGVRLEGAARAGDRAVGPLLIGQADTTQAGQIGRPSPWAARFFPVLIGAAAVLIGHWFRLHLIHPHGAPGTGPAGTVPGRHSFAAG